MRGAVWGWSVAEEGGVRGGLHGAELLVHGLCEHGAQVELLQRRVLVAHHSVGELAEQRRGRLSAWDAWVRCVL
eukprot:2479881-Rhodomonas_salina.1